MNLRQQIKKNQHYIIDLSRSMSLWLNTPHAQKKEIRGKIIELQDRTLYRLQELEVEGQQIKIQSMETVLSLLKAGVENIAV